MENSSYLRGNLRLLLALPYRLVLGVTGINILNVAKSLRGLPMYIKDLMYYRSTQSIENSFKIHFRHLHPCLSDRYDSAGVANGDYFHQDLWAARRIFTANPHEHWDIGSRVDGFVAHLLTFRAVNVIDIRELQSRISGLTFHQGDITCLDLPDNSIISLSCLHAMEHIGLGRYGDPVDPIGYKKGISELTRILAPSGRLYFSVPIGIERVEFNAQRVFDPKTIIDAFADLELLEFSAIDEAGDLLESLDWNGFSDVRRACGLFVFGKIKN
jgi:SAM-dependent methyltransferase